MGLIVQKFGGSSVANAERVMNVANIVTDTYRAGNDVVVVVSAQGDTTDDLIEKAKEINPSASKREMDMLLTAGEQISISLLAMAIEKLGYPVERLIYTGKAETFITYQIVVGLDTYFSDDESGAEEFTYRADIYSRVDYIALMRSAKRALKEAGFYGITFDPEVFEENTGYYHVPVEFKYMEV